MTITAAIDTLENLGDRLRERRELEGMTLRQVADLLGTSSASIWRIEHGSDTYVSQALKILCWLETFDGE